MIDLIILFWLTRLLFRTGDRIEKLNAMGRYCQHVTKVLQGEKE